MNARGFPLPTQRGTDLAHHLAMDGTLRTRSVQAYPVTRGRARG